MRIVSIMVFEDRWVRRLKTYPVGILALTSTLPNRMLALFLVLSRALWMGLMIVPVVLLLTAEQAFTYPASSKGTSSPMALELVEYVVFGSNGVEAVYDHPRVVLNVQPVIL